LWVNEKIIAMKRLKYFGYYLLTTDRKTLSRYLHYAAEESGRNKSHILLDATESTFRYNISLLDYFYFRFFEKNAEERRQWAGTGFMYEYQLRMNPKGKREVLENKISFLNHYRRFVKRSFESLQEMQKEPGRAAQLLVNEKVVLKGLRGQVGKEVEVVRAADFTPKSLIRYMHSKGYALAEEYVMQHPALMALSPSGLNTVRIFTQLHNDQVDILGARLRVSVNSPVDNMGAGNLAAPIVADTGIAGCGVYSDITRSNQSVHPITGMAIEGFRVPFWPQVMQMAINAALHNTGNRSIGWDIAITPRGPELIEGNHNWCKLLWQLPVNRGLLGMLEKYRMNNN
jgi:hypothetical protein